MIDPRDIDVETSNDHPEEVTDDGLGVIAGEGFTDIEVDELEAEALGVADPTDHADHRDEE